MMTHFFPEASVLVPQAQIDAMPNHPKDRHVAAAAVIAGASVIVTSNLKDFKNEDLKPWGIQAQCPDTFLTHLFDLYPLEMEKAVVACAEDRSTPVHVAEIVRRTKRKLPTFGSRLWHIFSEVAVEHEVCSE
jgi:hypothetical protein